MLTGANESVLAAECGSAAVAPAPVVTGGGHFMAGQQSGRGADTTHTVQGGGWGWRIQPVTIGQEINKTRAKTKMVSE